ncbi:hypothetical protein [Microcoleus sp. B5-D4]|uniref:hypothetical protein n=1 Tax=Microcoleus sp. B5-D4 TaxID=2818681 RepID=UPI002FD627B1
MPVPKQVIENGATSQLQRTLNKADRTRSLRHRFSQVSKFAVGRSGSMNAQIISFPFDSDLYDVKSCRSGFTNNIISGYTSLCCTILN